MFTAGNRIAFDEVMVRVTEQFDPISAQVVQSVVLPIDEVVPDDAVAGAAQQESIVVCTPAIHDTVANGDIRGPREDRKLRTRLDFEAVYNDITVGGLQPDAEGRFQDYVLAWCGLEGNGVSGFAAPEWLDPVIVFPLMHNDYIACDDCPVCPAKGSPGCAHVGAAVAIASIGRDMIDSALHDTCPPKEHQQCGNAVSKTHQYRLLKTCHRIPSLLERIPRKLEKQDKQNQIIPPPIYPAILAQKCSKY